MTISVIISSYRGNEQLTKDCIQSLNNQTDIPSEIIVVVDTKEEQQLFINYLANSTQIPLKIIHSGKKGLAAARNKGIEVSKGNIIAFIDDDAIADQQWLAAIKKTFESSLTVTVVGGPVVPIFKDKEIEEKFYWIIGCTSTTPPTNRPIGCNMAFHRNIFKSIGLFDENLGRIQKKLAIGEETEILLRIEKQLPNYSIFFNRNAKVFHNVPPQRVTLRYIIKRAYEEGYAKARIRKKYKLKEEQNYLRYYLSHLDLRTLTILLASGGGYIFGFLHSL